MKAGRPVYASRAATEQARALGVGCIEQEIASRRDRLTRFDRYGGREHGTGGRWVHGPGWTARVETGRARLNPERPAWIVTTVRAT